MNKRVAVVGLVAVLAGCAAKDGATSTTSTSSTSQPATEGRAEAPGSVVTTAPTVPTTPGQVSSIDERCQGASADLVAALAAKGVTLPGPAWVVKSEQHAGGYLAGRGGAVFYVNGFTKTPDFWIFTYTNDAAKALPGAEQLGVASHSDDPGMLDEAAQLAERCASA